MKSGERELIAMLIDRTAPSAALRRWLRSAEGKREREHYGLVLDGLRRLYEPPEEREMEDAVHYGALTTPIGPVLIAATERGVVRITFRCSEAQFARELQQRLRIRAVASPEKISEAVKQLEDYFGGKRREFALRLDLQALTPFQRRVLTAAARVPAGKVVSYGEIARRIGQPAASRAVGQALGANPIPIVIPCHRIVASTGGLGGYTGGLEVKERLLELEGVSVPALRREARSRPAT